LAGQLCFVFYPVTSTERPVAQKAMVGDTEILARLLKGYSSQQRPQGQNITLGGAKRFFYNLA
jgi:hypothetical protein